MEDISLSPVSITQKVIALHTTRINVCEKWLAELHDDDFGQKMKMKADQSKQFTDVLMNELSNYGDAVSSQVNRDEEYEALAEELIKNSNNDTIKDNFDKLDQKLVDIYTNILVNKGDLPESLQKIMESQSSELKSS